MYCKQCGTEIEAGAVNCSSCGTSVKEPTQLNDTLSVVSLVCGILSLLLGGSICPIASIICGAIVLNKDRQDKKSLIGIILSVISLLLQFALVAVILIIYFAMMIFVLLMPAIAMGF